MPATITLAITHTLISWGVQAAVAHFVAVAITWVLSTALSTAISAAAEAILAAQQKVTAATQNIQQPIPFRRRVYGRAKLGGYFVFIEHHKGDLYTVIAIASHALDAVEEYWLGDRQVTLDPNGSHRVQKVVYPPGADAQQFYTTYEAVELYTQLGDSSKTYYTKLNSVFGSSWDTTCIGYGVADAFYIQYGVKQKYFQRVYPGGPQPYRQVMRGALIRDPRVITSPETYAWTDNAVCVIADYLTHPDGWRVCDDFVFSGDALSITQASADTADELVSLHSGGTEKRYRIWGFYDYDEEPRQVLQRMLIACGGWLQPQRDGTIAIKVGVYEVPDVTITDQYVLAYEIQHYPGEFDSINEVRANFVDPNNDYQLTESYPWQDTTDIARRGYVKSATLDARHCPSFTQTRRIQKIASYEVSPEWIITLTTNAYGLLARNRRFIALDLAELNLNIVCRVTSFKANLHTGICTIGLASFSADAYGWTPATDEGPAPPTAPDTSSSDPVPAPVNLVVTVTTSTISGGTQGGYMVMTVDASDEGDLQAYFQYASEGISPTVWVDAASTGDYSAQSPIVPNGTYDVQAWFERPGGKKSEPIIVYGVVVNAASSAPSAPSGFTTDTVSPSSNVYLACTSPNSSTVTAVRFWRNSTNSFSGAADLYGPIYCSPNQSISKTDTPGAGTWYYFCTAENDASPPQESSPAGPNTAVV